MGTNTNKYEFPYWQDGDVTNSTYETQRWESLDAQLYGLFSLFGNGIIYGWQLVGATGLSITVTAGSGHVSFVTVESLSNAVVSELLPNTRNYIYATLTDSSYWDKSVTFTASRTLSNLQPNLLYLGYADTDSNSVTSINMDNRTALGFTALVEDLVEEHRHIGGDGNPQPVNLDEDVVGVLNQSNIPNIDASKVNGTLSTNVIPSIDHITELINQGSLTHDQLDSFVNALSIEENSKMGDVSLTNLLQLILALKHAFPNIDDYLVNEISIIPGITPDSYIDLVNTTAEVDLDTTQEGGEHTISGEPSGNTITDTKTWDTNSEFNVATKNNIAVDGNSFSLDASESKLQLDSFENLNNWEVVTNDLSSTTNNLAIDFVNYVNSISSGKVSIGSDDVELSLSIQKNISGQDWSNYDEIVLFIYTDDVQHGDIFFFLNDANYGTQSSFTKILDENSPTINIDTLQNGWQEVRVDVSSYVRSDINQYGLLMSTSGGMNTSNSLELNIDDIYLTAGNRFSENGYSRFVYGSSNFDYTFDRIRWDASIPTDSQSTGVNVKFRTRVGNSISDLQSEYNEWSSYSITNGGSISLPDDVLYKYIEVEIYLESSTGLNRSPTMHRVYLDFTADAIESSFNYDTQDEWESGDKFNIDYTSTPGSISISNPEEVKDIFYGTEGKAVQIDSDLSELYSISGSMVPRNTIEVLNDSPASLGLVTGIDRGDNGNIWVADADNNRIVEFDKYGLLQRGYYGSFIANDEAFSLLSSTFGVLHSVYNSGKGVLYIVFNQGIINIAIDLSKIYLKMSTQRFALTDSTQEITGSSDHILKITLNDANKVALNKVVDPDAPSISILSPYANERIDGSSDVTIKFNVFDFVLGDDTTGNRIRVTIDGSNVQDTVSTSITYSGLSNDVHTIKAELIDSDDVFQTNIEAKAESSFVINSASTFSQPYMSITSPKPNQIQSSSSMNIEFKVDNFSVIQSGQHLKYQLDSETPVDYYSIDTISLTDLDSGEHTFRIYMVDSNGDSLGYTYGESTCEFIIGLNSNATVKLYIDDTFGIDSASYTRIDVDVANIYFLSVYSPVDVQLIPDEFSSINRSGLPTVVIGKLRSITDVKSGDYEDGHSVIQLDMDGELLLSNNEAKFADDKTQAKIILGSAEKIGDDELLIGDSINKRAIIVSTANSSSAVLEWEYESDRYVTDFHIASDNDVTITVRDDSIDQSSISIRQGSNVIWVNSSSQPITVYSGTTTYTTFTLDADLTLYGTQFSSTTLNPGDRYSFKFVSIGEYNWFAYPSILTGTISVIRNRISSRDNFIITESDNTDSPFSSRVIKVDAWGNVLMSFGEGFLVKPRDARPLINGNILISC